MVEVLPLGGFDHPLTYGVKASLYETLQIGSLVRIPLGVRRIIGIVSSLSPSTPRREINYVLSLPWCNQSQC